MKYLFILLTIISTNCNSEIHDEVPINSIRAKNCDSLKITLNNEHNLIEFFSLDYFSLIRQARLSKLYIEKVEIKYGDGEIKTDTIINIIINNNEIRFYQSYGKKTIIDSKFRDNTIKLKNNITIGMSSKEFNRRIQSVNCEEYSNVIISDISGLVEIEFKFSNNVLNEINVFNSE